MFSGIIKDKIQNPKKFNS